MLNASISCTGTYGRAVVGSPLPILKCLVDTVCYLVTLPPVSCSPGGQSGTVPGPPRVPGHPHQGQKLPCVPGEDSSCTQTHALWNEATYYLWEHICPVYANCYCHCMCICCYRELWSPLPWRRPERGHNSLRKSAGTWTLQEILYSYVHVAVPDRNRPVAYFKHITEFDAL